MVSLFIPGRVNLIGEHIDYNGGTVLPAALHRGITIALTPRSEPLVHVRSVGFDGTVERPIDDPATGHWSDYVIGALAEAKALGWDTVGADVSLSSTLPHGAGLSSSAAVTVGVLKAAREVVGATLSDLDIAVAARRVENDYIGVPCGIMDQVAVACAAPGEAIALDTQTLSYDTISLPENYRMAVIHSGHRRSLTEGRYAERADECAQIKAILGTDDICHATPGQLACLDGALLRRALHCVSEERRVIESITALKSREMIRFGQLLQEGQASIRYDFEITVAATDALVETAVDLGALGARQTGGGFGGCVVACVREADYVAWLNALLSQHPDAYDVLA